MKVKARLLVVILAALLLAEFASATENSPDSPYRAHPNLEEKKKSIKTIVVLPPRIEMFQLTAGGVTEKMDEWTAEANMNVLVAISKELSGRAGLLISSHTEEAVPKELEANLEETHALFDAVNYSVLLHTYAPINAPRLHIFPEKLRDFDYSLGTEVHKLAEQADAFLLIKGWDRSSTGGRQALQVGAMVLGALVGVIPIPRGGGNGASVVLVDAQSGSLLWYYRMQGGYNLRDSSGAEYFVREFLQHFPIQ